MDSRGVTPLLGLILLFAITAIGATVVFISAVPMMDSAEQSIEQDHVEQSMVELNSQLYTTTSHSSISTHIDLDLHDYGAVTREDTGKIIVESEGLTEDIETSIGTIEWKGSDGTKIASEGGAVFRETGHETRLISAPPFSYDYRTTTVNFPVLNVYGDENLGQGDVKVRPNDVTTYSEESVIENENLRITVESEYCVGWETYFVQQAGVGAILDDCGDDQTVVVEIGYLELDDAFDSGITYIDDNGYSSGGNPNVTDERRWGMLNNIDDEIDRIVNQTVSNPDTTFLNETSESDLENGLHYVDGIEEGDQYDFKLTEGNATLVVEGDIVAGEDAITVSERSDNHVLRIYVTGSFEADKGNVVYYDEPRPQDGSVIQLYGTGSLQLEFGPGGSPFYEGLIYAPTTEGDWDQDNPCGNVQACFHSNPDFYGSMVVESVHIHGGGGGLGIEYDEENLEDLDVSLFPEDGEYVPPPNLTYLNVAQYDIEVNRN